MSIQNTFSIQLLRHLVQMFILLGVFLGFINAGQIGFYLLLSVLFFGVFYCGWVCPFGTCQEFIGWIGNKLRIKKYTLPSRFQQIAVYMRYILYVLGTLNWIAFTHNPRGAFGRLLSSGVITQIALGVLIVFCLLSLFTTRPFCNYFCEKGAQLGLISSFRLFGIHRNQPACIHCHKCTQTCPMNIEVEKTGFVRHPNCIGCLKCQSVCPVKCIHYGLDKTHFNFKKKN